MDALSVRLTVDHLLYLSCLDSEYKDHCVTKRLLRFSVVRIESILFISGLRVDSATELSDVLDICHTLSTAIKTININTWPEL